ncbi:hypothetical protein L211DRAFT_851018 [Terfezia boudieri ATCC MYA-4762]|uniref:Uncharacterized protein n=1 Tax=Terfezia boudieri ATCC MYA-4762 TaxID=1051890 RepID=A0A3N4LGN2_9PEZI|nr:hypothetical protein L211DRAFT_851018 [Terfezia boudieri ATCC MYA-4762]
MRNCTRPCLEMYTAASEYVSPEWLIRLSLAKSNSSVRAFIFEKIVIAHPLIRGCSAAGPAFNHPLRLVDFSGQYPTPRASTVQNYQQWLAIYVLLTFNYGSIDCALVNIKKNSNGKVTGTIIGIQITCAKKHENSQKSFMERSDDWRMILLCDNIKFKFPWIVKGLPKGKRWVVMEQTARHEEMWLRVSDLAPEIGKTLDKACSADAQAVLNDDNM